MSSDRPLLSLGTVFARQFLRHGRSIMTSPADVANPLLFFFMVITLFPLGLGPDPARLATLAPGILWVVALLASLMVSAKLFASDFEDSSLEQLAVAPYPLAVTALAEVSAHWLATGFLLALVSPLFGLMLGLPEAGLLTLLVSLLLGTICLTIIGALGSALTVNIRRGGLLLSLLIIPLNVPVLIFGTTAVREAVLGGNPESWPTLRVTPQHCLPDRRGTEDQHRHVQRNDEQGQQQAAATNVDRERTAERANDCEANGSQQEADQQREQTRLRQPQH